MAALPAHRRVQIPATHQAQIVQQRVPGSPNVTRVSGITPQVICAGSRSSMHINSPVVPRMVSTAGTSPNGSVPSSQTRVTPSMSSPLSMHRSIVATRTCDRRITPVSPSSPRNMATSTSSETVPGSMTAETLVNTLVRKASAGGAPANSAPSRVSMATSASAPRIMTANGAGSSAVDSATKTSANASALRTVTVSGGLPGFVASPVMMTASASAPHIMTASGAPASVVPSPGMTTQEQQKAPIDPVDPQRKSTAANAISAYQWTDAGVRQLEIQGKLGLYGNPQANSMVSDAAVQLLKRKGIHAVALGKKYIEQTVVPDKDAEHRPVVAAMETKDAFCRSPRAQDEATTEQPQATTIAGKDPNSQVEATIEQSTALNRAAVSEPKTALETGIMLGEYMWTEDGCSQLAVQGKANEYGYPATHSTVSPDAVQLLKARGILQGALQKRYIVSKGFKEAAFGA